MAIRIEERFTVDAPVEPVWNFLIDPRHVVACVPGGELGAIEDERTYGGSVKIAVGPLTLAYGGRIRLAEMDTAARRVKIVGEARERAGTDSARLTLESWLAPLPGGRTEVVAHARVDVAGRIVELGSGVLEQLGHVVFQDFAACVCATIEAEEARVPAFAAGSGSPRPGAAASRAPLRAVPLLFRAIGAWMAAWFRPRAR
jgi:carbon monoxide dehydrogenase subunit G